MRASRRREFFARIGRTISTVAAIDEPAGARAGMELSGAPFARNRSSPSGCASLREDRIEHPYALQGSKTGRIDRDARAVHAPFAIGLEQIHLDVALA